MVKVKICGITNLEDALKSTELGADGLGFNFYKKSKRYIRPQAARDIIKKLPSSVTLYGVFVNETIDEITSIAGLCKLNVVQLHGDETPVYVKKLEGKIKQKIIKVFRVKSEKDIETIKKYNPTDCFIDSFHKKLYGGTGKTIDTDLIIKVKKICKNIIIAGGLNEHNVSEIIKKTTPKGVDVASGLEEKPGKKNYHKLKTFIQNVKQYRPTKK